MTRIVGNKAEGCLLVTMVVMMGFGFVEMSIQLGRLLQYLFTF